MIPLRQDTKARASVSLTDAVLKPMSPQIAETLALEFARVDPWVRYPTTSAFLAAYLAHDEPGAARFELVVGSETAGAVGVRHEWLRGPYLQFLGIRPAYQRQGLGERILGWFEEDARIRAARNLWVAASDFNTGAIRFYERHGFKHVTALENLVADGRTEILLRKELLRP